MKNINKLLILSILSIPLIIQAKEVTIGEPGKPESFTFSVAEDKQGIFNQLARYANYFSISLSKLQNSWFQEYSYLRNAIANSNMDPKLKTKLIINLDGLRKDFDKPDPLLSNFSKINNKLKELYMAASK